MRLQFNRKTGAVGVLVLAIFVSVFTSTLSMACPPGQHNDLVQFKRTGHHISRRSFAELQCKGVYDRSLFARLDRICEDCYNLFREHQLHRLCREQCFTSDYFVGCVQSLQLDDELEQYKTWIKQLHGAEPDFF
ncbi:ion transport peptide-like isoform X1 [Chrysoperla carnea]|uniref:ion transport peptide-like isoform X1 n=1 Tax=Chrysoperla carnea TaxID=189513 RepID=UPI001D065A00|nr:ion transport peptide-like isoform X1 [Chrysoperla carnea]XP_044740705.1 ion transport peptide-like isoform X1 [Chrysoperla carnea]XP_044740707.1 ion transport peptide-like isoform X1 [Chrysoperla carnea]XP_044740708.1 ion transport peptide-like isoform X1 [Chrysoperla carnea]